MGSVIQEPERAPARGGVVYDLGHHAVVLAEIELVADAYLACRLHEHVPELVVRVQLAEQEHLDARPSLLLVAEQARREHFRVVEDHHVAFVEIIYDFFESVVLNLVGHGVDHHQAALVAMLGGILGYEIFRKREFEL